MPTANNIKRIVFACLLTACTAPAIAEWTEVSSTDALTIYIDLDTIRKQGSTRKFWQMWDFLKKQKTGEMSVFLKIETDCSEEKSKMLEVIKYSKNMGKGNVLNTIKSEDFQWSSVPPGTLGSSILKAACSKP